jgi:PEP-CTERM motif-containing protein
MEQLVRGVARAAKVLVACSAIVGPAAGAQIAWTNWTSVNTGTPGTASGTMTTSGGPVTVSYAGEVAAGSQTSASGIQYYNPNNSDGGQHFTTATYGADGPGTNPGFIKLLGGNRITNTLTFSTPVNDLYFAIISMGQQTDPVSYTFNNSFTITSQGSGWWGTCANGPCLVETGNVLTGTEGDGTLLFNGPISSVSWTAAPAENWHGFTVGTTTTTPEPSSMALLGTGLIGLVPMVRRRRK